MCRMLCVAAPDAPSVRTVLEAFRSQALRSATGPESHRRHPDGWGIVRAGRGRVAYVGRGADDASSDPAYGNATASIGKAAADEAFLAHVRQSSVGPRILTNAHPFLHDGWAFCHNGTIHGIPDEPGVAHDGTTDSERYFRRLLGHVHAGGSVAAGLRRCVREIDARWSYSSITCLFTDGTNVYGYRRAGPDIDGCGTKECQLEYYSLGWGRQGDAIVVAQEPTHLGDVHEWTEVPDDGFLEWRVGAEPRITKLGSAVDLQARSV